jgi:hypothetical protein
MYITAKIMVSKKYLLKSVRLVGRELERNDDLVEHQRY